MTPLERHARIQEIFQAAIDLQGAPREAYLDEACSGDAADIRAYIQNLIEADESTRTMNGDSGEFAGLWVKECPDCKRCYDDTSAVCPADGKPLQAVFPGSLLIDRKYRIERLIGRGGMGAVYLAARIDGVYSKPVAVKLLRAERGGADSVERFRQERKVLASLDHPNVAQLLDGGETADGSPYYVMDYIPGEPIDVYSDRLRLTLQDRLQLFLSVCAAVGHAHSQGIVHRDLKPGNILVNRDGQVKLLDFGIAKLLDNHSDHGAALTRTGMLLMTPEYASPEQVRGEPVGAASDIYSLGVILFELLTGISPYRLRSRMVHEIVRVVSEEEPARPSSAIAGNGERTAIAGEMLAGISHARQSTLQDLSETLRGDPDNIVLKALRKVPAERYGSVREFAEDIQRYLEGKPISARQPGWSEVAGRILNRHKWAAAGVAAGFLALATGALRISTTAVAAGGSFVAILVMIRWRLKSDYGQQYAARHLFLHAMAAVFNVGLFVLLAAGVYFGSSIPGYVFMALGLRYLYLLARWPWRHRWGGPMLFSPSATSSWTARKACLRFLLFTVCLIFQVLLVPSTCPSSLFSGLCYRMMIAFVFFEVGFSGWGVWLVHRVEIRARGPVFWGVLMEWRTISSYAWEVAGQDRFVLRLRRPSRKFQSVLGIPVAGWAKAELSAVLDRHLALWPDPAHDRAARRRHSGRADRDTAD